MSAASKKQPTKKTEPVINMRWIEKDWRDYDHKQVLTMVTDKFAMDDPATSLLLLMGIGLSKAKAWHCRFNVYQCTREKIKDRTSQVLSTLFSELKLKETDKTDGKLVVMCGQYRNLNEMLQLKMTLDSPESIKKVTDTITANTHDIVLGPVLSDPNKPLK
jgi:hypothetical protein